MVIRIKLILKEVLTLLAVLSLSALVAVSFLIIKVKYFRDYELNSIKSDLNKINDVEVINIWGHEDLELEEISARVRIKEKGEIVLNNLSSDVFNYPDRVIISEIGGHSFSTISCDERGLGIGNMINISKKGFFGEKINLDFESPSDVITNYDEILKGIKEFKQFPDYNYFQSENYEVYYFIKKENTEDKDPIYNLLGFENLFEYAKKLNWKRKSCYN